MKNLILMILISLSTTQAMASLRSVEYNAFPRAVSVDLSLVVDEHDHVSLEGNAVHNYGTVHFKNCELVGTQITCTGTWWEGSGRDTPASLQITQQADGTYKGQLLGYNGQTFIMGCLLSHDPL